jgi:hypothetical protein
MEVESASGVPGDCYTITHLDPSLVQKVKAAKKVKKPSQAQVPAQAPTPAPAPTKSKSKSGGKIPVFDPPKVLEDDDEITDEGWLFEPPPPEVRSRKHIDTILHLVSFNRRRIFADTEIDYNLEVVNGNHSSTLLTAIEFFPKLITKSSPS